MIYTYVCVSYYKSAIVHNELLKCLGIGHQWNQNNEREQTQKSCWLFW